ARIGRSKRLKLPSAISRQSILRCDLILILESILVRIAFALSRQHFGGAGICRVAAVEIHQRTQLRVELRVLGCLRGSRLGPDLESRVLEAYLNLLLDIHESRPSRDSEVAPQLRRVAISCELCYRCADL